MKRPINLPLTIFISLIALAFTCGKNEKPYPSFIYKKIEEASKQAVQNPPVKIIEYTYLGKKVYFISGSCCDNYSDLYDSTGTLLCHPDGGFTGKGDEKCTDFFEKRTGEKLVWEDERKEN